MTTKYLIARTNAARIERKEAKHDTCPLWVWGVYAGLLGLLLAGVKFNF